MTQAQIANAIGVSESYYQSYEYGAHIPSVYVALRIARALDTTVEELFPIEENS